MTTGTAEQAVLATAEQLLPVLISALTAGANAGAPGVALIAMAAEVIPPLIQSFGANSSQIRQLMSVLVVQVNAGQQVIDQAAEARGIPVESTAVPVDPTQDAETSAPTLPGQATGGASA